MSKDLEEFIAKHAYQDGHDKFSCRCVSVEALTYWMDGHVRVPVEPTEAMLVAARDWSLKVYGKPIGNAAARGCWGAMLNASKGE